MHLWFVSTPLVGMFSHLSTPLASVIFCNHSIRKHVFGKSDHIKFNTFSTCFVDLVPSLVFYCIFLVCWCNFVFHLAPISRKKPFRKSFQKKGAPLSQTTDYDRGPGLPDSPPRVRTSQTRNKSSSSKCCLNSCPWLWFRKIDRKLLFELASFANVSKKWKNEKGRCSIQRASPLMIWHALGRGPANSKMAN